MQNEDNMFDGPDQWHDALVVTGRILLALAILSPFIGLWVGYMIWG